MFLSIPQLTSSTLKSSVWCEDTLKFYNINTHAVKCHSLPLAFPFGVGIRKYLGLPLAVLFKVHVTGTRVLLIVALDTDAFGVGVDVNNNNECIKCLTCAGPKRL